jgi:flagellar biosynthetic protein FlhB
MDTGDRTQPATAKKIAKARRLGVVARSRDLTGSVLLMGGLLTLFASSHRLYSELASFTKKALLGSMSDCSVIATVSDGMCQGMSQLGWMLLPFFGSIFFIAIAINLLQVGWLVSLSPLAPQWNKLNIFSLANYTRTFGLGSWVRLAFSLMKLVVISLALFLMLRSMRDLPTLMQGDAHYILHWIASRAFWLGMISAACCLMLGLMDYLFQSWWVGRQLRMTAAELAEEKRDR